MKKKLIKFILFIFVYSYIASFIKMRHLNNSILNKNTKYINYDVVDTISNYTSYLVNNPVNMMDYKVKKIEKEEKEAEVFKTKVIEDKVYKPIIYLYNTHDTERYLDYTVVDAKNELSNMLATSGVDNLSEEKSVKVFLDNNKYKYSKSYIGSRNYLKEALNNHPTLTYFLDIHRDSVKKDKSTIVKDGKSYAKVLFIVGLDNNTYKKNLINTEKLNGIINVLMPGLSRGIIKKSGKGVNGVYNQDISENVFLIEIGGLENTKEEVLNTLNIVNKAVQEYIKEGIS